MEEEEEEERFQGAITRGAGGRVGFWLWSQQQLPGVI